MLDRVNLLQLAKVCAKANPSAPTAYSWNGESLSYNALNETLRSELRELAGNYQSYRQNKELVFSVMETIISEVLPMKVAEAYSAFADVQTVAQGNKVAFRRKLSARNRAKQFVTRAGLAGVYEVFKLGGEETIEIETGALATAVQISIEEFLDGRADLNEMLDIVMEGMDEKVYEEIAKAMIAGIKQLPTANSVEVNDFDEQAFDRLLTIAAAYGDPVIYTSYDFAVKMIPQAQWLYTEKMKDELWNNGYFTTYKGKKVIILPNGLVDETNTQRVLDPGYTWIIPSGGNDKPVKVVFEGDTLVRDEQNHDWSTDMHIYKKVGVGVLMTNNICSYIDKSLTGKLAMSDYNPQAAKYAIK